MSFFDLPALPRLFIGSSSDSGLPMVRSLQAELEARSICEVRRWDRIFEPSGYALDSLSREASEVDFAVLIATPDDTTLSRNVESLAARDNVILEFGLFVGALGRERTYMLATNRDMKLPSDVLGMTTLAYRPRTDGDVRAGLNEAALEIECQVKRLGPLRVPSAPPGTTNASPGSLSSDSASMLERDLRLICENARTQGWVVKKNSETTLRLKSSSGRTLTLSKMSEPAQTRGNLHRFVDDLRAAGLRVNSSLHRPL